MGPYFWLCLVGVLMVGRCEENLLEGLDEVLYQKTGSCPESKMDKAMCDNQTDQCQADSDCSGDAKCCSTGCATVCIKPLYTACEQQRAGAARRSRALGEEVWAPECTEKGEFREIQCNALEDNCWCVNEGGFEKPGTRARALHLVNCTNPRPCAGYLCRMLCPYGFELDDNGCPVCQCRDPCRGVRCPNTLSCELQEVPCIREPCPPLPVCKQPRSLSSLCPMGEPLTIAGGERPFLCGNDPGKPNCPPLFHCIVQPGHEYGVCCAKKERVNKPGTCPSVEAENPELVLCGETCHNDLHCSGEKKCCPSSVCGKSCMKPANMTVCFWQKQLAEVMAVSEKEGKGYIPQCSDTGHFLPRQCSRNGLVCWCVDPEGNKLHGSIGSASDVLCNQTAEKENECEEAVRCAQLCEYGYVVDRRGCPTCECAQPCDEYQCPQGTRCVVTRDSHCDDSTLCTSYPECELESLSANPCLEGEPLKDDEGALITCYPEIADCPEGATCFIDPSSRNAFCCPTSQPRENMKPGQCPVTLPVNCTLQQGGCEGDSECEEDHKCCIGSDCVRTCVPPLQIEDLVDTLPTMCEFLRDATTNVEQVYQSAIPPPECDQQGKFLPKQCARDSCWCVDEFGTMIPSTKTIKEEALNCSEVLESVECLGLVCRLGCDYGFELDQVTRCPLCECRDPCKEASCGDGYLCIMQESACEGIYCPALPRCVPLEELKEECPSGEALIDEFGVPQLCGGWAENCPEGYTCSLTNQGAALCCSKPTDHGKDGVCPAPVDSELCVEQCQNDDQCPGPQKCCMNGCGARVCRDPEGSVGKLGQCPYLVPSGEGSCEYKCRSDYDCEGNLKCCSNGCGTQCMEVYMWTGCQHKKALKEHQARESGVSPSRVYIPQCRQQDGGYEAIQCSPVSDLCWCSDSDGREIHGTRVVGRNISCSEIEERTGDSKCPVLDCNLSCPHGHNLDQQGCPRCSCVNPCDDVRCRQPGETCRLIQLQCTDEDGCLPLPICLPHLDNPCEDGQKALRTPCGPHGSSCPSSHLCHLSPLGEYAKCCPKPREVCHLEMDEGHCNASVQRWYFDPKKQQCEPFVFGGCSGNANNFQNIHDCRKVCPVLTACERLREKNSKMAVKYKLSTFIPECDLTTGAWKPTQCLPQLGVCWCVDQEGSHISGTLIRGNPICSARIPRLLSYDQPVCDAGSIIHACEPSLCDGAVCLTSPDAVCRINPCNGCSIEFYDNWGKVNCTENLSSCLARHQQVLNSVQWRMQTNRNTVDSEEDSSEEVVEKLSHNEGSNPFSNLMNLIQSLRRHRRSAKSKAQWPSDAVEVFDWSAVESLPSSMPKLVIDGPTTLNGLLNKFVQTALPTPAITLTIPSVIPVDKTGTCPSLPFGALLSLLSPECQDSCTHDIDCPSSTKCCLGSCGLHCMQPIQPQQRQVAGPTGMGVSLPACLEDETWSPVQWTGELAWCVDEAGQVLHNSLTKGTLHCAVGGKIVERVSQGSICPENVKPRVCMEECDNVQCLAHPEATCQADPCDQCKVNFYDKAGKKIWCEPSCHQPLEAGTCSRELMRYWFNSTSKKCQSFQYSGCNGNDNNFLDEEECQESCVEKTENVPRCDLPKSEGPCDAKLPRWWYNAATHTCELFHYGGCAGNTNNFVSRQHCEAACPDLVVCGNLWENLEDGLSVCSRKQACSGLTCDEHPHAICIVDPCMCTGELRDSENNTLHCKHITNEIPVDEHRVKSRCQKERKEKLNKKENIIPLCEPDGTYANVQCYKDQQDRCWCVDEAGKRLPDSKDFKKGSKHCEKVEVKMVVVSLGFQDNVDEEPLKSGIRSLLEPLGAKLGSDVGVFTLPEGTQAKFTLLGDRKVDIAHHLETQMKSGELSVEIGDRTVMADSRSSWFHHELHTGHSPQFRDSYAREIVQPATSFNAPYLAVIIIFSVLSLIVVCAMIVAVVMYRRKTTGSYPKETMENMAFSSPVYDIRRPYEDSYVHRTDHYYETIRQNHMNEFAKVHK